MVSCRLILCVNSLVLDTVSVTPTFTWKLGTIKGSAASTFRSFNQSFILAGKVLYRLATESGQSSFKTEPVAQFHSFLGDVAFVEVKIVVWFLR